MFTNYETSIDGAINDLNNGKAIFVKHISGIMTAIHPGATYFYPIYVIGNPDPNEPSYQGHILKKDIENILKNRTIITREEFEKRHHELFGWK